jgi:Zn-dependent metalloprotease
MKKLLLLICFVLLSFGAIQAQIFYGKDAQQIMPGTEIIAKSNVSTIPTLIKFLPGYEVNYKQFETWLQDNFKIAPAFGMKLIKTESDNLGFTHYRYQQTYNGYPIFANIFIVHVRNGLITCMNGQLFDKLDVPTTVSLDEAAALNNALADINADSYKWQIPEEEQLLKYTLNNQKATYYPKGELVMVPTDNNFKGTNFRLAYKFDIYAHLPMSRNYVFVDAQNGQIIFKLNRIQSEIYETQANAAGTAVTKYSGTRSFTTDYTGTTYRLRETGRGLGVETYDMNVGTNYGAAVDFTDADNNWNNVNANQDEVATDAHWGTERTWDYYSLVHGRNSVDNAGLKLLSYVHADLAGMGYGNNVNAFWDGTRMTYGDGDATYSPLTTLDICGHEITHGVTENTANLTYSYESGALNEGYSDIFGTSIEFYAKPPLSVGNWTIGEQIGSPFRSMSNPNLYSQPDTYLGTNWYTGAGDNGGVHTNSGVINYWYYLLCQGGSGTNDIGNAFSVTGITMAKAEKIAFRTLTVYLSASSNYADARTYSILASSDLYGGCSQETHSTTDAWYAVGVGAAYSATPTDADYTACPKTQCSNAPFTVQFSNLSVNGNSYKWYFGDGGTSTLTNPSHTYNTNGSYDVKLVAYGSTCGTDSITKTAFIQVGPAYPCAVSVPASGTGTTQTTCTGTLFDSGLCGDYADNTSGTITIAPTGALTVTLTFTSFNFEDTYDFLYVYDGPTTASPQVAGSPFSGTTLPGPITSTGGSITIRQTSDGGVVASGFDLDWACSTAASPPNTEFTANVTTSCTGTIQFTDQSTNGPTAWLWKFGDGQTSAQQNPAHTYTANGTYTVTMKATNTYGTDSTVKTNYITINMPVAPTTTGASRCGTGSVTLSASGTGVLKWYNAPTGGTLVNTGTTYFIPSLSTTTNYYVTDSIAGSAHNVGKVDSVGTGTYVTGATNYLIFDCYSPVTLVSAVIYPNGAGARTFELRNSSGGILQDTILTLTATCPQTVTLNFSIPVGTNLQLGITGTTINMFRNSAGVSFPYTSPGLISITNGSTAGRYYYFYNWLITEPGCTSARSIVTATINPLPTAPTSASANPTSICNGSSTVLSAAGGTGTTLRWLTGSCSGTSVGTGNNLSVSPSGNTTYYARWENACGNSTCQSASVTVSSASVGGTATAVSSAFCEGGSTTINLSGQTGTIQWQTNASGSWQNIPGATGTSYTTPILITTTSYRAIVTSGICPSDISSVAVITVWSTPSTPVISLQPTDTLVSSVTTGNQWYLNGVQIPGATDQIYAPLVEGDYTVIVTDIHGCISDTSAVYYFLFTGIENGQHCWLNIWPNPTDGNIYLDFYGDNNSAVNLFLTDMNGKLLRKETIPSFAKSLHYSLDLSVYTHGCYFIEVKSERFHIQKKIILN